MLTNTLVVKCPDILALWDYEKNKDFYLLPITQIKNLIRDYNIVKFMKDFYNMDLSNVKFVINLMCKSTNKHLPSVYL